MAAAVARPSLIRASHTPPPLDGLVSSTIDHIPVPNKYLPALSPGFPPQRPPDTPPASPPTKTAASVPFSLLSQPDPACLLQDDIPLYSIDGPRLAAALDDVASQPLPDPRHVFPWLHGLHPENNVQLGFFVARRRSARRTPRCLRGITIVKAGGDLSHASIKGAVGPDELLELHDGGEAVFLEPDPKEGFSVRNFQIQTQKMALVSDIVVYGDDATDPATVRALARQFALAQRAWRAANESSDRSAPLVNTFVLSTPFADLERLCPAIVAVDGHGHLTEQVTDFFQCERVEMCAMSRPSEIAHNVWLGHSAAALLAGDDALAADEPKFDVLIETSDLAQMPDPDVLQDIAALTSMTDDPQTVEFPGSGSILPPGWSSASMDGLVDMCRWIYRLANPVHDESRADDQQGRAEGEADGDVCVGPGRAAPCKVLIHCADGYTESSLLALAYLMFADACPVHAAWLRLHRDRGRDFFAYPSDVTVLRSLQPRILRESPRQREITIVSEPAWLSRIDGSLPSRILPYMYLGNLGHANNPGLLRALGIRRILSVGEPISWTEAEEAEWGPANIHYVDNVQDNGVDPLTEEFARCLDVIGQGKADGSATLVHCRVGVSRSATICIAEVMHSLGLSFPRAYCFVRARRLNVIIQPHLRFSYELLRWEGILQLDRGQQIKREREWASIAREIASMNRPYAR